MKNTTVAILISMLALFALTGCGQDDQRAQAPVGSGGRIALNADNEIRFLKSILAENPENYQALVKLGNISMDARRFQNATDAYSRALEIDPTQVNVRVDLGTSYRNIGRPDKAVEHYRKGIEYEPNHLNAHRNLGVVLAYDFKDALGGAAELEKYTQLAPAAPDIAQLTREIQRLRSIGAQKTP